MIALSQHGSVVIQRAGEVVLTLGLSIGAALLLRMLRRRLDMRSAGSQSAATVTRWLAVAAGVLSVGFLGLYERYRHVVIVGRPAAIAAIVLCGLMFGILAEGSRAAHRSDDKEGYDDPNS